jgi:DNA-binding NarL/FixJ family response regulator
MKILIVDDHAIIHRGLRRILEDEFAGIILGEAYHPQAALDLVSHELWNVVILDLDIPGRGGLDLLQQLRAAYPKLPVIVFSMHSEEQFAIRSLKAGASGYVAKDGDLSQLSEAVRRVLRGGRYVSAALAERLAADLQRDISAAPHEWLSNREFEVMRMLAIGMSTTDIADKLSLSVKTVSTYRTRVLEKLQLTTNFELIHYAIDHDIER